MGKIPQCSQGLEGVRKSPKMGFREGLWWDLRCLSVSNGHVGWHMGWGHAWSEVFLSNEEQWGILWNILSGTGMCLKGAFWKLWSA